MNPLAKKINREFVATKIWFDDDFLYLELSDGGEIKTPLEFYPRLRNATLQQRNNHRIIGRGSGIHWPDIDEDLSTEGIVLGIPARF